MLDYEWERPQISLPLPAWATPDGPTPMREEALARLRRRVMQGDDLAIALLVLDTKQGKPGRKVGWRKGKGQG